MSAHIRLFVLFIICTATVGCSGSRTELDASGDAQKETSQGFNMYDGENDIAKDKHSLGSSDGNNSDINTNINTNVNTGNSLVQNNQEANENSTSNQTTSSLGSADSNIQSSGVLTNGSSENRKENKDYTEISIGQLIAEVYAEKYGFSQTSQTSQESKAESQSLSTVVNSTEIQDFGEIGIEQILKAGSEAKFAMSVGQNSKVLMSILQNIYPNRSVFYESSAPQILSVDKQGNLFAIQSGAATITAVVDGKKIFTEYTIK